MSYSCGGAAAVFGAAKAIAQLAPDDVEVHFVVAACEVCLHIGAPCRKENTKTHPCPTRRALEYGQ